MLKSVLPCVNFPWRCERWCQRLSNEGLAVPTGRWPSKCSYCLSSIWAVSVLPSLIEAPTLAGDVVFALIKESLSSPDFRSIRDARLGLISARHCGSLHDVMSGRKLALGLVQWGHYGAVGRPRPAPSQIKREPWEARPNGAPSPGFPDPP